jgi:hypothetical protein
MVYLQVLPKLTDVSEDFSALSPHSQDIEFVVHSKRKEKLQFFGALTMCWMLRPESLYLEAPIPIEWCQFDAGFGEYAKPFVLVVASPKTVTRPVSVKLCVVLRVLAFLNNHYVSSECVQPVDLLP